MLLNLLSPLALALLAAAAAALLYGCGWWHGNVRARGVWFQFGHDTGYGAAAAATAAERLAHLERRLLETGAATPATLQLIKDTARQEG